MKLRVFHQNESGLPCSLLPSRMEARKEVLNWMENSHFDRTPKYILMKGAHSLSKKPFLKRDQTGEVDDGRIGRE